MVVILMITKKKVCGIWKREKKSKGGFLSVERRENRTSGGQVILVLTKNKMSMKESGLCQTKAAFEPGCFKMTQSEENEEKKNKSCIVIIKIIRKQEPTHIHWED